MRKQANVPATAATSSFRAALTSPQFIASIAAPLAFAGTTLLQNRSIARRAMEEKAQGYRDMLATHPHLAQMDQAEVGRIYNSLHRASPGMAVDPVVAGAWVDNVVNNKTPGMQSHQAILNAVRDLSGIEKNITDATRNRQQMVARWAPEIKEWITSSARTFDESLHKNLDTIAAGHTTTLNKEREAIDEKIRKAQEVIRHDMEVLKAREQKIREGQRRGRLHEIQGAIGQLRNERFNMQDAAHQLYRQTTQAERDAARAAQQAAHSRDLHNQWNAYLNQAYPEQPGSAPPPAPPAPGTPPGTKTSSLRTHLRALRV